MINKIVLSAFVVVFVGCGDVSKETSKAETVSVDKAPTIEIVANENDKEIKVKQKDSNSSDGTFYQGMTGDFKHGYDPNSQPANSDASVRVKPRTEVDANIHVRSPYEQIQVSLIVDDLSKNFRVKCSACHSDYANGVIGPSLLGKNSNEIFNAIADFKSGKKSNPLMDGLIDHMSDKEIRELADEIYAFNQKIKEMRSK